MPSILQVSNTLHYICSLVAAVFVSVVTFLSAPRTTGTPTPWNGDHLAIGLLILWYLAEGIAMFVQQSQQSKQPEKIHLVVLISLWAFIWSQRITPRLLVLGTSLITLAFEVPLQMFSASCWRKDIYHILQLASQTFRLLPVLFLVICHLSSSGELYTPDSETDESQPFLQSNGHPNSRAFPSYGTETPLDKDVNGNEYIDSSEIKRQRAKKLKDKGGWLGYPSDLFIFLPFLIPKKERKIQVCILISLLCILATRVFNILVPRQLGIVVDQLLAKENPFHALFIWLVMSLASHDVVSGLIESLAKIPIKQFSCRCLTNAASNHVLSLPVVFRPERDSAEVMKAIEQGAALTSVFDMLIITILPTVFDLAIAFVLLYWKFNSYVALAMAIGSVLFLTLRATGWNLDNRRESTKPKGKETKPAVIDKEGAKDLEKVEGRVALHDVYFSYVPRRPTVQDLSFFAEPGQTVGLVGETGAGKLSIMRLLLRFYDIDEGSITIDGYDILDITLSSLRNALGVAPQGPLLFNASILENMRYARPSATDEEIVAACRSAAIRDKISASLLIDNGFAMRRKAIKGEWTWSNGRMTIHGLWGNPSHMRNVAKALRDEYSEDELYILPAEKNRGNFICDGIELGGERVCAEIEDKLRSIEEQGGKITKLSFAGYSLGGLVSRYCGWLNNVWNVLGARTLSMSGRQLFTIDKFRGTNQPLLAVLADPDSIFMSGLKKFKRRTLYTNIVNDRSVLHYTSAITKHDPYTDLEKVNLNYLEGYEGVILDADHPIVLRPKLQQDTLSTDYEALKQWVKNILFAMIVGVMISIGLAVFLAYSAVRSANRIKAHESGEAGLKVEQYRLPLCIKEMREEVGQAYEVLNSSRKNQYLPALSSENDLVYNVEGRKLPKKERRMSTPGQPTLALTPYQFETIENLDAAGWRKFPVHIQKHRHSHAAIVVRMDKESFVDGWVILKHFAGNLWEMHLRA
ncbi:hypothetical protein FANTH_6811 [Fusarium anthophilum]|uniref:ABC transporter domain-containing protein n=1 Tax=Fusarium anthophilum TaxID=48485 RepID=A0A8H5E4T4_9HYPO|nr:hypothetical protein FANTH_6811 [Fusarium anthophilum]